MRRCSRPVCVSDFSFRYITQLQLKCREGEWASTLTHLDVSCMRPVSLDTVRSMALQFGHSLRLLYIKVGGTSGYSRPPLAFPKLEHLALIAEEQPTSYLQYFCNSPVQRLELADCYLFNCDLVHKSLSEKLFPDLKELDLAACAFWPANQSCDQMMEDCRKAGVIFELVPPSSESAEE